MEGKRELKKEIVRQKIIESGLTCFLEFGFKNTTMNQIAQNSNVGVGTIYNYYESKEELLIICFQKYILKEINQVIEMLDERKIDLNQNMSDYMISCIDDIFKPVSIVPKEDMKIFIRGIIGLESCAFNYSELNKWIKLTEKTIIYNTFIGFNKKEELINLEELIDLIHNLIAINYQRYISSEMTYNEFLLKLKSQFEFVFK